jgi:hypothetical protein
MGEKIKAPTRAVSPLYFSLVHSESLPLFPILLEDCSLKDQHSVHNSVAPVDSLGAPVPALPSLSTYHSAVSLRFCPEDGI